ncbi:DUF362 domain-containing protein [Thermodesulfobacteriota bacterium]
MAPIDNKNDGKKNKKLNRREFMKRSTAGAVGVATGMCTLQGCHMMSDNLRTMGYAIFGTEEEAAKGVTPMEPVTSDIVSTLALCSSPKAVRPDDGLIDQSVVQLMFDRLILSYTGSQSIEEAWKKIIPDLKATDTIGIKINCINPSLPSNPEVVNAVINHLVKMGISENNIIVWDRGESGLMGVGSLKRSGYELNDGGKGVKYTTTSNDRFGYDNDVVAQVPSAKLKFPVSNIISKECDYLINLPQLRNHNKTGITQCMKNYYGAVPLFDKLTIGNCAKMHKDNCNPAVPELYNNEIFISKTKLHVCDALMTIYEGGPMGNPQEILGCLMVGKDPVALDYTGLMMIEQERQKRGIETLMRRAKYIQTAAEMGIGTNNPDQMKIKHIQV